MKGFECINTLIFRYSLSKKAFMMKKLIVLILLCFTCSIFGQAEQKKNPKTSIFKDFIPKGYVIFEKVYGDLNQDGVKDCVLIIKKTDKRKIVNDELRGKLDRNRRGIIILFKTNDSFQLACKNFDCFSSENEDGGVYYAPDLSVSIKKGKLFINYEHGRYGNWNYIFKYQFNEFELISYNEDYKSEFDSDEILFDEMHIDFINKKKLIKEVKGLDSQDNEIYKHIWKKIRVDSLIKLKDIKDMDELDMSKY